MKNGIQPGKTIPFTAAGNLSSGDGVQIGQLFGVVVADVVATETGQMTVEGVFSLPKNAAQAWTEGQLLYWTGTEVNTTASGNLLIGSAVKAALAADTTGEVRLNGIASLQIP